MKKIFIYYSYTGNGDAVAEYFKEKGFEIRKVIPQKPIPKNRALGIIVGGYKATVGYKDKLCDFNSDLSDYDEVWIGSPVWNARLSSPINTVLSELDLTGKKVTFVLYSASGFAAKAEEKIHKEYPEARVIELKEPKRDEGEMGKIGE